MSSKGNEFILARWNETEVTLLDAMRFKLKEQLQEQTPYPDVVGDRRLLRFLRGKQHKVDDAVKQYSDFLKWRKDNKVDDIRAEILYGGKNTPFLFPNGKKILDLAPQIVISSKALDKKGQPLAMEMYNFSPHNLFKEITLQEYMVFLTYSLEYRALVMEQMSEEAEQRYLAEHPTEAERQTLNGYGVVLLDFTIRDLEGVGLSHLINEGRMLIQAALDVGIPNYPEYLGKCYMVNVPWVFNTFWHFIKGLLDEQTVAKISLSSSGQILDTLLNDIPLESIPKALGGTFEEFNEPFEFDTSETGPFFLPADPHLNLISPTTTTTTITTTTIFRSEGHSGVSFSLENRVDSAKIPSHSFSTSSLPAATSTSTFASSNPEEEDSYHVVGRVGGRDSCAQGVCMAANDDDDNDDDKIPRRI